MEKLKPCPFCGGESKVKGNIMFGGYSVVCLNEKCGAHVFFYGAEASRSANERRWNRRAERNEDPSHPFADSVMMGERSEE